MIKESSFLSCEPFSQVVIPAVGKSTNEVTDVIILISRQKVSGGHLAEFFGSLIINAFDVQFVLPRIIIYLIHHLLVLSFLVLIVQKLDLFQHLKSRHSDVLELVNTNYIVRWLVVKADLLGLGMSYPNVLLVVGVNEIPGFSVLDFFVVNDHFKLIIF